MYKTTVMVDGMHCAMCEAQVKSLIMKVCPEASLKASHRKNSVTIEYDFIPSQSAIRHALASGGYELKDIKTEKFDKPRGFFARLFCALKSA